MRNLYLDLGFRRIMHDADEIEDALDLKRVPAQVEACGRLVLLHPLRKARYDWALEKALELNEARSALDLPPTTLPPFPGTRPIPMGRDRMDQAQTPPHTLILWTAALVLVALVALGWRSTLLPDKPSNLSTGAGEPAASIREKRAPTKEKDPSLGRPPLVPVEAMQPIPPPSHGWIQGDPDIAPRVPWTIETDPGQDYLLTLLDAQSQRTVLIVYLHGGEPFHGLAPEGEFELTHSSGTTWYGLKLGFGPGSTVVRSEEIHRIIPGPDSTWVWELHLHPTSGEKPSINPVRPVAESP